MVILCCSCYTKSSRISRNRNWMRDFLACSGLSCISSVFFISDFNVSVCCLSIMYNLLWHLGDTGGRPFPGLSAVGDIHSWRTTEIGHHCGRGHCYISSCVLLLCYHIEHSGAYLIICEVSSVTLGNCSSWIVSSLWINRSYEV